LQTGLRKHDPFSTHFFFAGSILIIAIAVNTKAAKPYVELDYCCDGKPINYPIQLGTIR